MIRGTRIAALLAALAIVGCGGDAEPAPETATRANPPATGTNRAGAPTLEKIGNFDRPDYIVQAPGSDDLYVVEQPGRIRIVRDGRTLPEPALDIADEVSDSGEQGLLSVAFPPDFQSSRLAYVYFTGNDQDQHVVEYRANDDGTIDESSAREVLRMDDFASNHNGGLLLFGPDGHLYIGTGDGGTSGAARTRSATARTSARCSGRSSGSTPGPRPRPRTPAPHRSPTRCRRTTPSSTPRAPGPRSATTGSETRGGSASTASPGRS